MKKAIVISSMMDDEIVKKQKNGKLVNISQTMLETLSISTNTDFGEICLNDGFKRGDSQWM